MKKFLLALPLAGFLTALAAQVGATSTVILDPPDIPSGINSAYQVAQPLLNSVWGWVWVVIGIIFVGGIVSLVIGGIGRMFGH